MPLVMCVVGHANRVNSWRRQGQGNRQNQERSSGTSTPTKESARQQAMPAPPGPNAWAAKGKPSGPAPAAHAQVQANDPHVPVRDFNANEVKDFLRKSMSLLLLSRESE